MDTVTIYRSPRAAERVAAVANWLRALSPGAEALVVAPNWDAADDLLRAFASERAAAFAIHRLTLDKTIALLAAETLAKHNLAPAAGLTVIAIAARAIHMLTRSNALGHFTPIADRHGFASAAARTITELRLSRITAERLRALDSGAALAALLEKYEAELADANLADRAAMISMAVEAIGVNPAPRYVALPTLFFDVPIRNRAEADFLAKLASRAERVMFTIASGDMRTEKHARAIFGCQIAGAATTCAESSLVRLQDNLFETATQPERPLDDSLKIFSAPGEAREAVEIAREIHAHARAGVTFDRIAVLLRTPTPYNAHLEEALARAGIPAYFARGTLRPEPGGRALLTLLNCAAEHLSARRFAEYLSLAQVPDPEREADSNTSFMPEHDLMPLPESAPVSESPSYAKITAIDDPDPVIEGSARAPWRWEELIVDASVIGGRDRWRRRLNGLEEEFRTKLAEIEDVVAAGHLERRLIDLDHLKQIALPIIDELDRLPRAADWGEWLNALTALTNLAVRDREPVLAALAELAPLAPVGPIGLDEVRLVLAERLGKLTRQPPRRRYGSVYVAPAEDACGLSFDSVFIPGLAERLFPQKLIEDPILPDRLREMLGSDLVVQNDRRIKERLALKLAAGAAERALVLSYPRIDIDQGRPRVPSFYALEAMRAAEGHLRGFEELGVVAATVRQLRLGWPAPTNPAQAIDNAEFDLALLDKLVDQEPERTIGTANYLLTSEQSNPHLARSLRARARRWLKRWTVNDGLVDPDDAAKAALVKHGMQSRSFSATALQKFAECPYRFALYTIMKLEPREEIEPIETIDPLVRGAIFHEVQFEVLSALREWSALPVTPANLDAALGLVAEKLSRVANQYREKLAPAIERVWDDGIASISADLSEWLRRSAQSPDPWHPYKFELSFGLRDREQADPKSCEEPIAIAGGLRLRGSIDLVERDPIRAHLRITDHKTGKARAPVNVVVGGGRVLQPVLYSLVAESLLAEPVDSGRLYYCTLAGGFEEREVKLNDAIRDSAAAVIKVIADALETGFLPAAPDERECQWCDYRLLCGPHEQRRSLMKPSPRLKALRELRVVP